MAGNGVQYSMFGYVVELRNLKITSNTFFKSTKALHSRESAKLSLFLLGGLTPNNLTDPHERILNPCNF